MAAAAAGNNGGNKSFQLKVVAMATTSNGAAVTREEERVFTLPHEPMLNEDTALPFVRKVVESFLPMKIPMDRDVIVEKIVYSAIRLYVATADEQAPAPAGGDGSGTNNNKSAAAGGSVAGDATSSKWVYSKDGLPLTTVKICVDHDGFVTVIGDFESDDDSDDSDDSDEEDEVVEAMEE
ncbi:unnamed protein product [Linum trigynum]|uniref:Uncharacterized protein n=1 Tax=Linum trigynum TaxID=586398 RepID=A0AAV2E516_9ROSI